MSRLVKLLIVGALAHALITFVLFSLVWLLPDGGAAWLAGASFDVLSKPLMGPGAPPVSNSAWLNRAQGLPLYFANSLLWGALFAIVVYPVLRLRRPN